jgi:arsenate reductase-like glutaredoxin family protein
MTDKQCLLEIIKDYDEGIDYLMSNIQSTYQELSNVRNKRQQVLDIINKMENN